MENKKILVVDDDIDVVAVIETLLENEGYQVISAHNKVDGVKKAKEEKPALAILDVMMTTHFEGFELAKELFDSPETKAIPRLMQTSIDVLETSSPDVIGMAREFRKNPEYKELEVLLIEDKKTKKAGIDYRTREGNNVWVPVDGFLAKPVDSKKLLPEIERLLSK
ncbi:MAG: response regulator [Chloroflexia bacterium]|nr:response regulator [Chloroflexia bacterium]